jgi:hypothetical protein
VALRPLLLPDGSERVVAYIGDVKVAPDARAGLTLHRLARAAHDWVGTRADLGFGVVMDGTPVLPSRYTGRAGVPFFPPAGALMVYRLPCGPDAEPMPDLSAPEESVRACFRALGAGRLACPPGRPAERSLAAPEWLLLPDGSACGCLEDTRRAKRLIADDGTEMISAHLSCFAYRDTASATRLLHAARARAAARGFPALFAAVPACDTLDVLPADAVHAPATVFGDCFPSALWLISTSEI